jgi:hypothetical protein
MAAAPSYRPGPAEWSTWSRDLSLETPPTAGGTQTFLAEAKPSAFAETLCDLAAHPELVTSMGRKARSFAAAYYSKDRLLSDLDRIYRQLLEARIPIMFFRPFADEANGSQ